MSETNYRYLLRLMTDNFPGSFEESLGCLQVSLFRKHRIDQVSIPINCPVEVAPLATHAHIGFIAIR
jgi:hypothetical protein